MNLYSFIGVGAIGHRSVLFRNGEVERVYGYEEDGLTRDDLKYYMAFPAGLGVNFKLSERLDIGLETGIRYAISDRLDAKPVTGSRNDMYGYASVGITFRFGRNPRSMDWSPTYVTMYPGDVDRLSAVEQGLEDVEAEFQALLEKHEGDLAAVRESLEELYVKEGQLTQRTQAMFAALEDVSQELARVGELAADAAAWRDLYYSVQVMALKTKISVEEAQSYLNIREELTIVDQDGWYKYMTGRFYNLEEALLHMQRMWGRGIRDAFIVRHEDGRYRPR